MNKSLKKVLLGSLVAATVLTACGTKANKELVVDTIEFSGDFFTSQFSSSSYDMDVVHLISGTGTIAQTSAGKLVVNKGIVENDKVELVDDADGNKVVTWKIRKDLKWSTGKPITAKDFAFSLLFQNSKEWKAAGASVSPSEEIIGLVDYSNGKADAIKGVKLVDDHTISLTIDKSKYPYFYEYSYYGIDALSLEDIGEGLKVESGDFGVKLVGDVAAAAKAIKAKQVDSRKPTSTYGKYVIDKTSETEVVFKLNPNYVGNYEGVKPTIPTIVLKANKNEELRFQRLSQGEVDYVPSFIDAKQVAEAKKSPDKFTLHALPRNGYGVLNFANEFGPTKDVHVRRGIAHLTNRSKVIADVFGGDGIATHGEYAIAQWMVKEKEAELNEKLNKYSFDVALANKEFDQSEYRFEADGVTPFDVSKASETYLRHNSKKEPLAVHHVGGSQTVLQSIESGYKENAAKVGMKYTNALIDFKELLKLRDLTAANDPKQSAHMFTLANGFTGSVFDPYISSIHSRNIGDPLRNGMRVKDAQIDKLAEELRAIAPQDTAAFANKWLEYQVRYNEILPALPLYSNYTFDAFSNAKVKESGATAIRSWSQTIEYMKLK